MLAKLLCEAGRVPYIPKGKVNISKKRKETLVVNASEACFSDMEWNKLLPHDLTGSLNDA